MAGIPMTPPASTEPKPCHKGLVDEDGDPIMCDHQCNNNVSTEPMHITLHPEINIRGRCSCGGIGIPADDGEIYFFSCRVCGKRIVHPHSCTSCDLLGKPHEAEFNDLRDEDGSKFLNAVGLVDGKIDPNAFSWVALHGCKTWRKKI